jgi:hypothetical protein
METIIVNGKITPTDLPTAVTSPIERLPEDLEAFRTRLRQGGNLIFDKAELTIGSIDVNADTRVSIAAEKIVIRDSTIITNGNVLELYCSILEVVGKSEILSFKNGESTANLETHGDSGGDIFIYVSGEIKNRLSVRLDGQNGGVGRNGDAGRQGAEGYRGRSARNGPLGTCRRGAGNGGRGGAGEAGTNGTNGGDGGDGGILRVFYVEAPIQPDLEIAFSARSGLGGNAGLGGEGGLGGKGGKRGADAGNCGIGGRNGADGPNGPRGRDGDAGKDGEPGKSFIKNINL